jgi:flagellar basal body-associated protein FliL
MRHKKHHLPVIALAIVFLLLAAVVYFAIFFKGVVNFGGEESEIPQMYAPESGAGAATGGL